MSRDSMKDISSDMIRDFMKKPITAVSSALAIKTAVVETTNLEGLALDWAVAKAVGISLDPEPRVFKGAPCVMHATYRALPYKPFWPTSDWNQAGELVDAHIKRMGDCGEPIAGWDAVPEGKQYFAIAHNGELATGATKRIAVCRAVVLAKLGDAVEVPAELVAQ